MNKRMLMLSLSLLSLIFATGCPVRLGYCFRGNYDPGAPYRLSYCDGSTGRGIVPSNGVIKFRPRGCNCSDVSISGGRNFSFTFFAAPSSVDLQAPPATITMSGSGISGAYGMPLVEYYDGDGNFVGQGTVTMVGEDGSWLQASPPDLSSVYSGNYEIWVTNMAWDGNPDLDTLGKATMSAYGRDHPACDPDGSQEMSCYDSGGEWNPDTCSCFVDPCLSPNPSTGQMPICY